MNECINCGEYTPYSELNSGLCPECYENEFDNDPGPTGHGDICWSDADDGL